MAIIIGQKVNCRTYTGAELNCTSINITTYYCERLDGASLAHGTPIECDDVDDDTRVNCITANATEMDRYDVPRWQVNWPRSSTHNGAIYYCESQSRNTSVRTCNTTNVGLTCYETNCTESIVDEVIYCDYRNCTRWERGSPVSCRFRERYCLDLNRRPISCPGALKTKCIVTPNVGYTCKEKKCTKSPIDRSIWLHRRVERCEFTTDCRDTNNAWYRNCTEAKRKKCATVYDKTSCIKRKCAFIFRGQNAYCHGDWEAAYCFDRERVMIQCPEYKMRNEWTKCTALKGYIYDTAVMCAEELCTLSHLLGMTEFNYCRAQNYCYMTTEQGVNKTIACPKTGENCRTVYLAPYRYYVGLDYREFESTFKVICVQANCTYKYEIAVECKFSEIYCHNYRIFVDCPSLSLRRKLTLVNDYFGNYDDLNISADVNLIETQNNTHAIRTQTDVFANTKKYGFNKRDKKLLSYASPKQIQTDVLDKLMYKPKPNKN